MALSINDLENSGLYLDSIVEKQIVIADTPMDVIEGVVTSFNAHKITYSYNPLKNTVSMSYFDTKTNKVVPLVNKWVRSMDDFEKALVKADKNLYAYFVKN